MTKKIMKINCVPIVYAIFVLQWVSAYSERKLSFNINPGCGEPYCNTFILSHVKADGPNDTVHNIWDFTEKPVIFVAVTPLSSQLNISWNKLTGEKTKAVNFTAPPFYSFGIVLDKIWEYNDENDTGILDLHNHSASYVNTMEDFKWHLINQSYNDDGASIVMQTNTSLKAGNIRMKLTMFGWVDHSEELPRLLHTENSTQVELEFDNVYTGSHFNASRFAAEFTIVGDKDKANSSLSINAKKSLDDENSPGVFTLIDVQTPSSADGQGGGYLQWRPVAYVAKEKGIVNSTETNTYGANKITNHATHLNNTLMYAYYELQLDRMLVESAFVSFGLKEDGFYKKTNYTSWTFMVGYGKPPDENFSLLVILVISIGLGVPALLIIISGIVMSVRRISEKKDGLFLNS